MITPRRAERVMKKGVDENGESLKKVKIRTILTCKCKNGVCAKCYGQTWRQEKRFRSEKQLVLWLPVDR